MTSRSSLDDRAAAQFVDVISIFVLVGVASFCLAVFPMPALVRAGVEFGIYAGAFLLAPPIFESRLGWTPGKRLCGIMVVGEDGRPPRTMAAFLRNIIKYGLSALVLWQVVSGRTGMHDARAATRVVNRETQRQT